MQDYSQSLQENWASSRLEGEISWFFSSCGKKLGDPIELLQGPQGTSFVISGKTGLLSSCEGQLGIPLKSWHGNRASPRVERETWGSCLVLTGILEFLSSLNRGVRLHLVLRHGSPLSSLVVKGLSGLLSS